MSSDVSAPVFFLLRRRLPSSETQNLLGKIVKNFQDPTFDYVPSSPLDSLSLEIYNRYLMAPQHENAATITTKASQDARLAAKLQCLLSFSSVTENGGSTSITSPRITTRRLRLEPDYFAALLGTDAVREKLLDMCPRGGRAYLVVGTMSFHTAELKAAGTTRQETESKATVATGTAAAAAVAATSGAVTIPALQSGGGNIELEAGHTKSSDWTMESTASAVGQSGQDDQHAEEVFAVSYRIVRRDLMGLGRNPQISLKPPSSRGGQHFGSNGDGSDSEDDKEKDEIDIESEIQGVKLSTEAAEPAAFGRTIGSPAVLDHDSKLLYFP